MISIIAAIDQKRGLGKNNELLFKIPEDLKRFKELTTNHPVIMGRKTYESIGRLLPNRKNIIITHNSSFIIPDAMVVHSLQEGIEVVQGEEKGEIFVIGGGQIFEQALPIVGKLYLTIVEGTYDADTFFPEYSSIFKKVVSKHSGESGGYKYTFLDLER